MDSFHNSLDLLLILRQEEADLVFAEELLDLLEKERVVRVVESLEQVITVIIYPPKSDLGVTKQFSL